MAITNADKQTVRSILRECLPSGFPQPLSPLTIGAVACRIHDAWQSGRLNVLYTDKAVNDRIISDPTPLPAELTDETVRDLLVSVGAVEVPDALAPYWSLFKEQALELILERGRNLVLPHPRAF